MEDDPARRVNVAVIFDHAQYLMPTTELSQMAGAQGSRLVRLLSWAQSPYIKRSNIAICLLCDRLSELNERLVGSPHVATLEIPMPDAAARQAFITWFDGKDGHLGNLTDFTPTQLADLTSGLSLVSLERLLARAEKSGIKLDANSLKVLKKGLIERQARGLVEFVEPPHTLDDFVGNDGVRQRLHRRRGPAGQGPARRRADGLPDLRAGRHRQDLPGRVLRRLGRRPLRQAPELPLEVRRRDRGQPRAAARPSCGRWGRSWW